MSDEDEATTTITRAEAKRLHTLSEQALHALLVKRDVDAALLALGDLNTELMSLYWNGELVDWTFQTIHLRSKWEERIGA